jgi:hypothetical protein
METVAKSSTLVYLVQLNGASKTKKKKHSVQKLSLFRTRSAEISHKQWWYAEVRVKRDCL